MHCITLDLPDLYLEDGKVFLDPFLKQNGVLKALKKARVIKEICSSTTYNYVEIPIAILNMGILRQFDSKGVKKYISEVNGFE